MPSKKTAMKTRIRKLAKTAEELRQGGERYCCFNETRLLSIKSLCENHEVAQHFAMYLAQRTLQKMEEQECPKYQEPEQWEKFKALAREAFQEMEHYLHNPTEENESSLYKMKTKIRSTQNTYRRVRSTQVRMIESREILLLEYAMECVLSLHDYAYWVYYLARNYARRYDPHHGTGLIPESAPMVQDIVDFWEGYYFGE